MRLSVPDAFEFTPRAFPDDRGLFTAPFQEDVFRAAVGHRLRLGQSNHSVSKRGSIRGVHFAETPPGQAKYVYCARGSLLDVVVDVRVGSPTFGKWDAIRLDMRQVQRRVPRRGPRARLHRARGRHRDGLPLLRAVQPDG